jgi:2-dehydropantoate 2-reductase
MKIVVVGSGAIGCLLSARLKLAGLDVVLVDHRADRAGRLSDQGIVLEDKDGQRTVPVQIASTVPADTTIQIVAVKSYSTINLALNPNTTILSMQNGLGNIETLLERYSSEHILCGVTSEAATLEGVGHVRHAASGETLIGSWTTCDTVPAVQALVQAGFRAETTESPGQALWRKVIVNSAINPITALVNLPNGRLLEVQELRSLLRNLVVEAVKVASTEGYRFETSLVEHTEDVCRQTTSNISSMLQDVRAGRETEIEAISGEILRRADLASLPCPRTRVVYQLIKGLNHR